MITSSHNEGRLTLFSNPNIFLFHFSKKLFSCFYFFIFCKIRIFLKCICHYRKLTFPFIN